MKRATNILLGFLLILIVYPLLGFPQTELPAKPDPLKEWNQKLSPRLKYLKTISSEENISFVLVVEQMESFLSEFSSQYPEVEVKVLHKATGSLSICATFSFLREKVLPLAKLKFVDYVSKNPREESAVKNFDLSANRITFVHQAYPNINGNGQVISIKEFSYDTMDVDLRGRNIASSRASSQLATHATVMASIAAGAGNSFYTGKGVAPQAKLSSADFLNIFPDPYVYFESAGIKVQNHSYGTGIASYYGAEAVAYDTDLALHPELIHVFSAGNSGDSMSTTGPYQGIAGFSTLTGNYKHAKNVLTIGAVDSFGIVSPRSSKGPAFDGRIKPELVAFGQDGSSGAAALVSGTALLLQDAFQELYPDSLPSGDLIRSVLFTGATDIGTPGPDFESGYGNLHVKKSVELLLKQQFFQDSISEGETKDFMINLPSNVHSLTATLAWIDPPASPNIPKALIHDLDLELIQENNQNTWQPFVLSTSTNVDSLGLPARRGIDRLNNQEQIRVVGLEGGKYMFRVEGFDIPGTSQGFSLSFDYDTLGHFQWEYPVKGDILPVADPVLLRWDTQLDSGRIEMKYVGSEAWEVLRDLSSISEKYYSWEIPDTLAEVQLRMFTNSQVFVSDTFVISPILDLELELLCEENGVLSWGELAGAANYKVSNYQNLSLQELGETDGKYFSFSLLNISDPFFTVTPILPGRKEGLQSLLINLDFQSAPCYTGLFTARADGDQVNLELKLNSLFNIKSIEFSKWVGNGLQSISKINNPSTLNISASDLSPMAGLNSYFAQIVLENDLLAAVIAADLLYVSSEEFLVYPNPQIAGEEVFLLVNESRNLFLRVYDLRGRVRVAQPINGDFTRIDTEGLAPGYYPYQIIKGEEQVKKGVIQLMPQ